ncbi:MAG: Phosphoglycerate kinase [Candidatus Taylorbacteria bacterium]|nr:Phosphoglycerate kinase [Candidatus Taylorbacteria bacterium]
MTPTAVMLADRFYVDLNTIKGKKILLRVDFNVSIKDKSVGSDFRIKRVIPTIRALTEAGAKVILLAHIDDKEGGTLEPVAKYLVAEFPRLFFVSDIFSNNTRVAVDGMAEGDIILFENLRKWPGEKANDPEFAAHLASFGDIYINEAFSVSHRKHASIDEITNLLPSYLGTAFKEEITELSEVFYPHKPFLVVMGGAKFETKVPLVAKFLDIADLVLVGGAIANDFFKAKDFFVGDSLVSEKEPEGIRELLNHNKLIVPLDVYTSYKGEKFLKHPNEIGIGEKILDVGDKTIKMLKIAVAESEFVLWNGPLGKAESGFGGSTEAFAKILADSKKMSIVGGGDVISAIEKLGIMDKFTFVSSGGGAMLDFLADETLVGIESVVMSHRKQNFIKSPVAEVAKKGFFEKIKGLF